MALQDLVVSVGLRDSVDIQGVEMLEAIQPTELIMGDLLLVVWVSLD